MGQVLVTELFAAEPPRLSDAFLGWTLEPDGPWTGDVRCPALSSFRRVRLSPLRGNELLWLIRSVGVDSPRLLPALYAPPRNGWWLVGVPDAFVEALAKVDSIGATAAAWCLGLQTDKAVDWQGLAALQLDWPALVRKLVDLARDTSGSARRWYVYEGLEPHG